MFDTIGVAAIAAGAFTYYLGARKDGVAVALRREGGGVITWSGQW